MSAIGTYGFVNAKVRAMRSDLLKQSDYTALIHARSLRAMIEELEQSSWISVSTIDIHSIDNIEQSILLEEQARLLKIKKYCKDKTRRFMDALLLRYDGEFLKILLRYWHQKETHKDILIKPVLYSYPVYQMLEASTLSDFLLGISGTPFEKPLQKAMIDLPEGEIFPLELAIDRTIVNQLLRIINSMRKSDRILSEKLTGLEIDIKNLNWVLRFKDYYHLSLADIDKLLLPKGYRLDKTAVQKLHVENDLHNTVKSLFRGVHINLPDSMQSTLTLEQLEFFFQYALMIEAQKAFAAFPFSIGAILGYYYLIRIEARNIRTLIQAKSYEFSPEEIEPLLVI